MENNIRGSAATEPLAPVSPNGRMKAEKNHDGINAIKSFADQDTAIETTRYLSAATHVNIEYARAVVRHVVDEPFRALPPTLGVDVAVVARWALAAVRRRTIRDITLAIVLAVGLLFTWLLLNWTIFIVIFAVAWGVVAYDQWYRIYHVLVGQMIQDNFDPASAPEPRGIRTISRLAAVEERRDGNLVVFPDRSSAFVGCGKKLDYQHFNIDLSKGNPDKDGKPREAEPFTSRDLHLALVDSLPRTALEMGLTGVRAVERLCVSGRNIRNVIGLLGDPLTPPSASVDDYYLQQSALNPTPEARTYVCVEMPAWKGQLVVTLFFRAVRTGKLLYMEQSFRVLYPIRRAYTVVDRLYWQPPFEQAWRAAAGSFIETVPTFLSSPFRMSASVAAYLGARRRVANQKKIISHGCLFDYGATRSIREIASDKNEIHHFLQRDFILYLISAQEMLSQATSRFLESKNVDLAQYSSHTLRIINNTINNTSTTIKVGDINNSSDLGIGGVVRVNRPKAEKGKAKSSDG